MTYSKAIQTSTSMSASSSDLDSDGGIDARRRKKKGEGGSGRETEEDMRKRILEDLEEERRSVERELKELKEKGEEQRVTGKWTPREPGSSSRLIIRAKTSDICSARLFGVHPGVHEDRAASAERWVRLHQGLHHRHRRCTVGLSSAHIR